MVRGACAKPERRRDRVEHGRVLCVFVSQRLPAQLLRGNIALLDRWRVKDERWQGRREREKKRKRDCHPGTRAQDPIWTLPITISQQITETNNY